MDVKGLSVVIAEANQLSSRAKLDKREERRLSFLLSAAAAIKAGATLEEMDQTYLNTEERRMGLPETHISDREKQVQYRGWKSFLEKRDMTEGSATATARIGTYSNLGYFVPTGFYPELFTAMASHDVLFNEDDCTVIKTTNGRVITIPLAGDIENVAAIVGEGASRTSTDISSIGQAVLAPYTYASPRFVISMEADQDMDETLSSIRLANAFFADRIARGASADLLTGNGTGKTLGLITALSNLGVIPVTAAGSAANTGGSETGANSIGSADFANVLASLNEAYLSSNKVAFIMNRHTLGYVNGLVSKMGTPLDLVKYDADGNPSILGVPVKLSPSMQSIGASQVPVLLGDFNFWATRLVTSENLGLTVIREAPGLVENGNVGVVCFARVGGALLYKDTSSPCPFVPLQNHS
jgi:HK97 family phage major capsid protein